MAAEVKIDAEFEAGSPSVLFVTRQPVSVMDFCSYDVTPGGTKFLSQYKSKTHPIQATYCP